MDINARFTRILSALGVALSITALVGFSLAATPSPPPPDPAATKITIAVSSWYATSDAVLVDGRGRRTGRSGGKIVKQIPTVIYRYAANETEAAAAIEPGNGQPGDPSEDYDYMHARTRHTFTIASSAATPPQLLAAGHAELRLKALAAGKLHVSLTGVEQGVFRDRDTLSVWVKPGDTGRFDLKWVLAGDSSGVTLTPLAATAPTSRTE
jgi:hypothetical protein